MLLGGSQEFISDYARLKAMKRLVWIGIIVGGIVGGYVGTLIGGGNSLGGWSILLSTVGSLAGLWIGYKIGKVYF